MAAWAAVWLDCVDAAAGLAAGAISPCKRNFGVSTDLAVLRLLTIITAQTTYRQVPSA